MNGRLFRFANSGNPLVQVLSVLVLAVALAGAVILGAFVIAAIVGLAVVAFVVYTLRAWWLRRRPPSGGSGPGRAKSVSYIEGEFEVIDSDEAKRRRSERR